MPASQPPPISDGTELKRLLSFHGLILAVSVLMLVCVFANKFLTHLGVPILILFIGAGMVLGSEGIFGVYFDNPSLTHEIGNIALCFIIFHGGMELNWRSVRPVLGSGLALSTVGVLVSAALVGLLASFLTGMSFLNGMLLGAVLSSTDAAAVFSTLKSQKLRLKGGVAPLLEFESGSNDPVAYMLTVALIGMIKRPNDGIAVYLLMLLRQIGLGALIGVTLGLGTVALLKRVHFNIESLYFVVGLSLMMLTYSLSAFVGANCFLAVFLGGILIGNAGFSRKIRFVRFFESQSWLAQILLFLTLGLQVYPSRLLPISLKGLAISAALILVIRPAAVMPALTFFRVPLKEQLFVSFAGFRGAASIVFATYPFMENLPVAQDIFDIVFFIASVSILLQGTCLKPVAKRLGLIEEGETAFAMRDFNLYADELSDMPVLGVYVPEHSPAAGKPIRALGLPEDVRIVALRRGEGFAAPKGKTILCPGDRLLLTSPSEEDLAIICTAMKWES